MYMYGQGVELREWWDFRKLLCQVESNIHTALCIPALCVRNITIYIYIPVVGLISVGALSVTGPCIVQVYTALWGYWILSGRGVS